MIINVNQIMKTEKRGGYRPGSGRPKTNQKTFTVRCHPMAIESIRVFAKLKSKEYENN